MTTHYIKSWSHFFDAIKDGRKLHDLRKMDREYNVGDILVLQRYDNINGNYTGEELEAEITYITSNKVPCAFSSSALDKNYAILSLKIKLNYKAASNDIPELFVPFAPNREPKIVIKGGPIKSSPTDNRQLVKNPVSPNPNAEYYQYG